MDDREKGRQQPEPRAVDLERAARRGFRIARIAGKKLARKIEETIPATKGTDWKKVLTWGAVGAAAVLVGGELLGDGAGEVAEGAGTGGSPLSSYDRTGVSVLPTGILSSDGAGSNFG